MHTTILRWLSLSLLLVGGAQAGEPVAANIIREAWEHMRGQSSSGEMQMTIHRPDWERTMAMRSWSQGSDKSLVRVTQPRKDAGNATLTDNTEMWSFSPRKRC